MCSNELTAKGSGQAARAIYYRDKRDLHSSQTQLQAETTGRAVMAEASLPPMLFPCFSWVCSRPGSLARLLERKRGQVAGRLSCIKGTASSLGREELLNSGMGLAVCSQLGLCVRVRRGPRVLWASFRCAALSDLENPSSSSGHLGRILASLVTVLLFHWWALLFFFFFFFPTRRQGP